MNYYVYRNAEHVGSFESEDKGREWVLSRINAARQLGAKGHPEYRLCWNGTTSVTLVTWRQSTFAELDARIARMARNAVENCLTEPTKQERTEI